MDSNILMGIVAFIVSRDLKKILDGKIETLSKRDYILLLMGTAGVTLTMIVTFFYLAPTIPNGWFSCFSNSNLFLHLINPILSIVALVFFEKTNKLSLKNSLWGIVPMCIYSIFYITVSVLHSENGRVLPGYDIYGFFGFGLKSGFIVFPIVLIITFGLSACLYGLNHIKYSFNEKIASVQSDEHIHGDRMMEISKKY